MKKCVHKKNNKNKTRIIKFRLSKNDYKILVARSNLIAGGNISKFLRFCIHNIKIKK